ncbi:hypothetical protein DEO72_LG2g3791 [Vigna unguiculata]|uniref:Uncharacterized protein n=1 Tax=Vigna unguiculata TaxID=3917 RepID=A0A4D6L4K9_VIGUN|nr:hypothetical protein DEO72_LG2g3791 [Vigna unguiculata]
MSQDYQTRQFNIEEDNLSGPIRTRHNVHTHTSNTCQPKPQLKSSSCSSTISSHNSRDVIPSHNSRNSTCLTPVPSHNSRDTFRAITQGTPASRTLGYLRSFVDHAPHSNHDTTLLQQNCLTLLTRRQALPASKSPGGEHVQSGAKRLILTALHLLLGSMLSAARHHTCMLPSESLLSPGGSRITVRRHISNGTI